MKFTKTLQPLAVLIGSLAFGSNSFAFQPLVTDDTGTQGSGGNQLELAGTRTKVEPATGREMGLAYTRGLTDTLDVFIEAGRQRVDSGTSTEKGPTNTAVGAKWRFYENERKTSLAVKPIYILPQSAENETKGLGTGKASYEVSLILTQEMGWGAVHANLVSGHEKYRVATGNTDTNGFSVAPVWNVNEQLKLAVDLGVSSSKAGGISEQSRFGELGAIYSPNADLDFALGFIRETNRATDETAKTVTAGVTWRFK